jgi:hypothetical protein
MTRYVWRGGRFVLPDGTPMHMPERDGVCLPQLMRDIPEYISPVGDHALITSRSHQREDLKRHDCVMAPPRKKRELRNPKYRAQRGLPPLEK